MKRYLLILLLVAGCSSAPKPTEIPDAVTQAVNVSAVCLAVKPWTPDQEAHAAADLTLLPGSILNDFMADYGRMRDQSRACVK